MTSISNCIHNGSLPRISSVFLVLTQACNLKCKYCFVVQKPKFMSYETAKLAANFVAENANLEDEVPSINFFGGEPLLMWDEIIVPLTKYIRESYGDKFNLSMTTNGLLLDEPKLIFMRKNNIGFMVSIDGGKATQDVNRPCVNGESSFNIIGPRIPLFLRYNPNMTFRATIDHDNASAYLENHVFAYDQGYKNVFSIVNVFSKWNEEEKKILKCQISKLGDFYLERLKNNEYFSVQPLESMFYKIKLAEKAEIEKTFRVQGEQLPAYGRCGLGASRFASVGTDGTLYSCQEMCDNDDEGSIFEMGHILNGVSDSKRRAIFQPFKMKEVVSDKPELCNGCPMFRICDGACTVNNYFVNKDLNVMPSILCQYYIWLYEEAMRISKIAKEMGIDPSLLKKKGIE